MEKLEDITKSMRQWVERIGPIPSHEIVAKVFDWARRIEACKNEVKPCINAASLRQAIFVINDNVNSIQQNTKYRKWKTGVLMQCSAIKSIVETALEEPCRNADRAECDSLDHAAQVFVRETGIEIPEHFIGVAMVSWMNSFCKWLFEVRK